MLIITATILHTTFLINNFFSKNENISDHNLDVETCDCKLTVYVWGSNRSSQLVLISTLL